MPFGGRPHQHLWAWQHERGEAEGRKTRPTCVVVAVRGANDGLTHLALLAITTQPPQPDRIALGSFRYRVPAGGPQRPQTLLDRCRRIQLRCRRTILVHRAGRTSAWTVQQGLHDDGCRSLWRGVAQIGPTRQSDGVSERRPHNYLGPTDRSMQASVLPTAIVPRRDRGKIALVDLRTGQRIEISRCCWLAWLPRSSRRAGEKGRVLPPHDNMPSSCRPESPSPYMARGACIS